MGSGVVNVGRRGYAVGLYWENSPSGRVVSAAKEAASQPGQKADFYAVRAGQKDGHVPQFGLGQTASGHKAGMPAFAGCLANQQPGSWAGAFRLREGTVVIVVRDDLIVPDGDQLFIDENEARERLLQEISFGGLPRIYAPESWAIPGADNMPISLLLDERRDVKLQPVKTPKIVWASAAGFLFLLVAGLGIAYYNNMENARHAADEAAKMNALARARAAANQFAFGSNPQPDYPPPERKWENKPEPLQLIEACRAALAGVPAATIGWRMTSLKCDGSALSMKWQREKNIPTAFPKDWIIDTNAVSATSTVALPKLAPRGHEDLFNQAEITRRYLLQNWPGSISRASDDPPPPPPPDHKGPWNPPPAPWVKRSFTFTVQDLPSLLPAIFQDLPGVIVMNMTLNGSVSGAISGTSWTVDGVIYENRN